MQTLFCHLHGSPLHVNLHSAEGAGVLLVVNDAVGGRISFRSIAAIHLSTVDLYSQLLLVIRDNLGNHGASGHMSLQDDW